MDWRLRRAGVGDAPALAMVAAASFLEAFAGILDGADIVAHCHANSSPERFAGWAGDPDCILTVAEHAVGAAPLGYTLLAPPDLPIPTRADDVELRRIYTLRQTHGSGLGPALMARAVADVSASGAGRILLGVYGRNRRARAFYQRHGFVVVGERQFRVGAALHDDLIYARDL